MVVKGPVTSAKDRQMLALRLSQEQEAKEGKKAWSYRERVGSVPQRKAPASGAQRQHMR